MLRSMFSGVSGLRSHQTMMDVVGNNIANVNTTGYKSSSVVFADTLSQLTKAAGAPTNSSGGTNPSQVGLGVRVNAITQNMTQGSAQATGKSTDLMLQGEGMFAVQQGEGTFYSRNGSFTLDANGSIVTNDGGYVMGWKADAQGAINTNAQIGKLVIPSDAVMPAVATTSSTLKGNIDRTFKTPTAVPTADPTLPGTAPAGTTKVPGTVVTTAVNAYDAQGILTKYTVTFTNTVFHTPASGATPDKYQPSNDWKMVVTDANGTVVPSTTTAGSAGTATATDQALSFDPSGTSVDAAHKKVFVAAPGSPAGRELTIDLSALTAYVGSSGASNINPSTDGAPIGTLTSYAFGTDGVITGNYSNGYKQTLGQIAIASFNNVAGLRKEGNSLYSVSTNSGNPVYGIAGQAGRGGLLAGSLEMSNVDLSAEFTSLILAQRGFQANSKVITSSDEILQDLVNLKR
ncbi:flagellar hook protein FlgE [Kineococcus aurantiacus]|uniref:Flagellar hook protein FlgE n=1 Tax=Kineococcus aurantiacus TaxID=37633 RepID=A0A7Y9J2U2_9ACTN|nr:flagellar hook protein FlgE [Kineococcus aurantiacus]NYD24621.1 flagellar hook protein FlgE [Kineococcus aurantiacus]